MVITGVITGVDQGNNGSCHQQLPTMNIAVLLHRLPLLELLGCVNGERSFHRIMLIMTKITTREMAVVLLTPKP
jgi:hypothetical protein